MPRELKAVPEGKGPVSQENPGDILNELRRIIVAALI